MSTKHLLERGRAIVERLGITLQEHLGTGGFGAVYSAVAPDGTRLAVKFCEKTQYLAYLEREAKIQLGFKHENLDDPLMIVMVMEYCDCTLTEYLDQQPGKRLSEDQFRVFARQLLAGLRELHNAQVSHRDIKPDNVLMRQDVTGQWIVKLADFGFAKASDLLTTQLGSPIYTAPEVATGHYNAECDLWSLGVVMYEMLVGRRLFQVKNKAELDREINSATPAYKLPADVALSACCRDFVEGLLVKDPNRRFTFEQVFSHPFVRPRLAVYHLGRPTQLDVPVLVDYIELDHVEPSAADRQVRWLDIARAVLCNDPGVFANSKPEDVMLLAQDGVQCALDGVVDTSGADGFRDVAVVCLPANAKLPTADAAAGEVFWDTLYPPPDQFAKLANKRHTVPKNSVYEVNVRFEQIQLVLRACNDCSKRVNHYACAQKELVRISDGLLRDWRPVVKRLYDLQRALRLRYNELVPPSSPTSSPTAAQPQQAGGFPCLTIIPMPHPAIPTIAWYEGQAEAVHQTILSSKKLRDAAQELFDSGATDFGDQAACAAQLLEGAREHLKEYYPELTDARAAAVREWNFAVGQCGFFVRAAHYLAQLEYVGRLLAAPRLDEAALRGAFDTMRTIAQGSTRMHISTPTSSAAPSSSSSSSTGGSAQGARGRATRAPTTAELVAENAALRQQNEALEREVERLRQENELLRNQLHRP